MLNLLILVLLVFSPHPGGGIRALSLPDPHSRYTVPFQYGWRFHYGDDPSSPPLSGPGHCSTAFEKNLQDYSICSGMERNPNRFSEKDCRLACCYDPNCMAWQAYPLALGRACFHAYKGMNITCMRPEKPSGIGGGRRQKSPSPPIRTDYSFATADATSTIDQSWAIVNAPHDFIAEYGNFTNDVTNFKQGYLPRNASWYRKHFKLPQSWEKDGGSTHIHFEGIFHHATIFLNGHYVMSHECGYTGFTARIDNATAIRYGDDEENVLSVRTDASFGSGHWYEGGGIYRPVHLVHIPSNVHIVHDGFFVTPETDGSVVVASVELQNLAHSTRQMIDNGDADKVAVRFTLVTTDGKQTVLATNTTTYVKINMGSTMVLSTEMYPAGKVSRWSIQNPMMYSMRAEVIDENSGNSYEGEKVLDFQEVEVGFRTTSWKKHGSFMLNDNHFKLRGFSHHNSIGGLGVAIPERIYLFRVQASRALGSNIWRMSHNPYVPALYKLLDKAGVMCWDENRDYGAKYLGGAYVTAMHDMVKRDRNHPSIIIWSFCNEYECQQNDPEYSAKRYRAAAYDIDGTRPVTANDITYGAPSVEARLTLDVQGGSHSNNQTFAKFHKKFPSQPLVLSECCSCMSQRKPHNTSQSGVPDRDLPTCIAEQNSPAFLPDVAGSLGVWTLMDYFGEPAGTGTSGWPYVSCDFGNFDIAGFPKPHAFWYAANWLQSFHGAGRPPLPNRTIAHVLSLPPPGGIIGTKSAVEAVTTAPFAELFLDGDSQGILPTPLNDLGEFTALNWTISDTGYQKNATLLAWSAASGGEILAQHTLLVAGTITDSYKIKLTLDVPSISTGTGTSLLLDGRDTAMIRASIVDGANNEALVSSATNRITWRVVSGPGMNAGISNGDPASHEWMKSDAVNAFGGLARGMFRVTLDCTSEMRELAAIIDVDSQWPGPSDCKASNIVVEASSPGFTSTRISIPVSNNVAEDSVFSVAARSTREEISYVEDFVG
jgi:hypothetical protein